MYRFRVPEIFLGCFLTVAVLAVGMTLNRQQAPQPLHKNLETELTGSTWLTKDAAGFFAFISALIVGGQAVMFFVQLRLMREGMSHTTIAAQAAKESAVTAKMQAEVARDTLTTMQDTAKRQLRAYLVIEAGAIENFEPGKITTAHFWVRNVGQTPPHDVVMATGVVVAPRGLIPTFDKPSSDNLRAEPNARRGYFADQIEAKKDALRTFSQDEIDAVLADKSRLCVGGRVYYKDIFDNEWHTDFLYVYSGPETRTMIAEQYQTGNERT
jgi:hypothetical protein